jgi:hypothetical protein
MNESRLKIISKAEENRGGLFGQVLLFVFEILPSLYEKNIYPIWEISSTHYSVSPHGFVLPGAFNVNCHQVSERTTDISFSDLRNQNLSVLGNDWKSLSDLWHRYFAIPDIVLSNYKNVGEFTDVLGIHYRGTDKQVSFWDTNPVSPEQYLTIIKDMLEQNPQFLRLFVATDDPLFVQFLKHNLSNPILNFGQIHYHKAQIEERCKTIRTLRAVFDCYMLSRCKCVITTSSALPAFAKILNPELDIYRVAASKLFADIPYFPIAYISQYTSSSQKISRLIGDLMYDDWTTKSEANRFREKFFYLPRYLP